MTADARNADGGGRHTPALGLVLPRHPRAARAAVAPGRAAALTQEVDPPYEADPRSFLPARRPPEKEGAPALGWAGRASVRPGQTDTPHGQTTGRPRQVAGERPAAVQS